MSLESWKKQFYPTSAHEATKSDRRAVLHSLVKWSGALPANTTRHGVRYHNYSIHEPREEVGMFEFGVRDCALCLRYRHAKHGDDNCYNPTLSRHCPIVRLTGQPCDRECEEENDQHTPSTWYQSEHDPVPMVTLLINTLAFVLKEK